VAPTTLARYPGDCDFLPIVKPHNISQRLSKLMYEVDCCTSKWVLLLDTMPTSHPFGLGRNIHCANMNADPEEARIFLDVQNAHETIIAHELAHLWFAFVEDGDGWRVLRDRSDAAKVNQLDFIQSFVLDIRVNDFVDGRGFDTSPINKDQFDGLEALRELMMTGLSPWVSDNCGWRRTLRIRRSLKYLCEEKIWRLPYSDLRTCLYRRCNNVRISCDAGCDPGDYGDTPGRHGQFRDHIILCPPAFNHPDLLCLTESMLHEMIHSCGDLHCPLGDIHSQVDQLAQSVFNHPHCPT
jgi:hypothetical protein